MDKCSRQGIVVFNTPGANANAVKELTLTALLLSGRGIVDAVNWAQALKGKEQVPALVEKGKGSFVGPELRGKTLGVIGLGAIGVEVANGAALGLEMKVVGFDPAMSVTSAWHLTRSVDRAASLDQLLGMSDYITVHVPLLSQNQEYDRRVLPRPHEDGRRAIELLPRGAGGQRRGAGRAFGRQAQPIRLRLPPRRNCWTIPRCCASRTWARPPRRARRTARRWPPRRWRTTWSTASSANSVNFPDCDPPYTDNCRIGVLHENIPSMLSSMTGSLAADGINIEHLSNLSRGSLSYTVLDLDRVPDASLLEKLGSVEGIFRVRLVQVGKR